MGRKLVRKDRQVYIDCSDCGHRWAPDPDRWSALVIKNREVGRKMLSCSQCGAKVKIPADVVRKIMALNG